MHPCSWDRCSLCTPSRPNSAASYAGVKHPTRRSKETPRLLPPAAFTHAVHSSSCTTPKVAQHSYQLPMYYMCCQQTRHHASPPPSPTTGPQTMERTCRPRPLATATAKRNNWQVLWRTHNSTSESTPHPAPLTQLNSSRCTCTCQYGAAAAGSKLMLLMLLLSSCQPHTPPVVATAAPVPLHSQTPRTLLLPPLLLTPSTPVCLTAGWWCARGAALAGGLKGRTHWVGTNRCCLCDVLRPAAVDNDNNCRAMTWQRAVCCALPCVTQQPPAAAPCVTRTSPNQVPPGPAAGGEGSQQAAVAGHHPVGWAASQEKGQFVRHNSTTAAVHTQRVRRCHVQPPQQPVHTRDRAVPAVPESHPGRPCHAPTAAAAAAWGPQSSCWYHLCCCHLRVHVQPPGQKAQCR
jgi:hypothetical protein